MKKMATARQDRFSLSTLVQVVWKGESLQHHFTSRSGAATFNMFVVHTCIYILLYKCSKFIVWAHVKVGLQFVGIDSLGGTFYAFSMKNKLAYSLSNS